VLAAYAGGHARIQLFERPDKIITGLLRGSGSPHPASRFRFALRATADGLRYAVARKAEVAERAHASARLYLRVTQ
jgi:hypothetical protein